MRPPSLFFWIGVLAVALSAPQAAPPLATVIERASQFAVQQRNALTSVRADEDYLQELRRADGTALQTRRLESEVAFVQLTDSEEWLAFRNVMRVDGSPTGTDTARLEKLFRQGAVAEQGRRIAEENAIHNIGSLHRTFNIPTFPTHLLMPQQHQRFRFRKTAQLDGAGGSIWLVSYDERERPTIVRTMTFRDVPIKGQFWIAPDDGRLVRATLQASVPVQTELEFTYRLDATLGGWVPSEMRERYRGVEDKASRERSSYDIVAVATYSNYRKFGVDVRIK